MTQEIIKQKVSMVDTKKIFQHDVDMLTDNVKLIAGMDEVGRGPFAGPVVTACVIMPYDKMIDGVFDSKKLSAKAREKISKQIMDSAISVSINKIEPDIIDQINILNATKQCMKNSYNSLTIKPDLLLIDAVKLGVCNNEMSIIKGDATSYAIACASIVAKVYRDNLMQQYAKTYPEYDFENNMGYGTKKHTQAILTYGVTPIHRLSFLNKLLGADECEKLKQQRQAK